MDSTILTPVLALIIWSLIVWICMYSLRIPAMQAAKIDPDDAQHPGSLNALPSKVRAVADNYNHLMEQPTIFYALAFYTHLSGHGGALAINLAWGYVVLRVLHSLTQNTINRVIIRFGLFVISSLVLIALVAVNLVA